MGKKTRKFGRFAKKALRYGYKHRKDLHAIGRGAIRRRDLSAGKQGGALIKDIAKMVLGQKVGKGIATKKLVNMAMHRAIKTKGSERMKHGLAR